MQLRNKKLLTQSLSYLKLILKTHRQKSKYSYVIRRTYLFVRLAWARWRYWPETEVDMNYLLTL